VRPQAQTAEKRRRILDAALTVFGKHGYNKASLVDIAELAGMTHAGVLHHFGSKDRLLVAVLEHRDAVDVAGLEGQHVPTGKEMLEHLLNTIRLNMERAGLVQAYAVLSAESVTEGHPAQSFFRDRFAGLRGMVVDGYRAVAPAGTPASRLEIAATATIAVMDGLQVQWLLDPEVPMPEVAEATIAGLVDWLAQGQQGDRGE
jgi:AcrR family transcriptional regulator